jgi:hypothetical protein
MGPRKARPDDKLRAVPSKAFREALTSRYRRLKIEGGVSTRLRVPTVAARYPGPPQIIATIGSPRC